MNDLHKGVRICFWWLLHETDKISACTLNTSVMGIPAYNNSAPLSSQILDMNEDGLRIKPSSYNNKTNLI